MELTINDLSLKHLLSTKYEAAEKICELLTILVTLKRSGNLSKLMTDIPIRGIELAAGYYIEQLLNDSLIKKDQQLLLKTLIINANVIEMNKERWFETNGKRSYLCMWAHDHGSVLVSLNTNEIFSKEYINGNFINKDIVKKVHISNIAALEHINTHKELLKIRVYESNPKHKVNYGWGSPMDLDDATAQRVLNSSIPCDGNRGHLINKYLDKYYSFRCHHDNKFHGYIDNTMPEDLRNLLREK